MTLPHLFWPERHTAAALGPAPETRPDLSLVGLSLADLFQTLTEGFYVSENHLELMLDRIERPLRSLP